MKSFLSVLVVLTIFHVVWSSSCSRSNEVSASAKHKKQCTYNTKVRHSKRCGSWWRSFFTCYYYRSQRRYYWVCSDGYTGSNCDTPICNGDTKWPSPCWPGYCASPGHCVCNRNNYYKDGPNCRACRSIAYCESGYEVCTTAYNQICVRCQLEKSYQAYNKSDGTCQVKCSWLPGRRCYPGTCKDMLLDNCQCVDGFGGSKDCNYILPNIVESVFIIKEKVEEGSASNDPIYLITVGPATLQWTNRLELNTIDAATVVHFWCDNSNLGNYAYPQKYIIDMRCGLVSAEIKIEHIREQITEEIATTFYPGISEDKPFLNILLFKHTFDFLPKSRQHGDRLKFTVSAKNGGFVAYHDFAYERNSTYRLYGVTASVYVEVAFDVVDPVQVCLSTSPCNVAPLKVKDLTAMASNVGHFEGWFDELSGIERWDIITVEMAYVGGYWRIKKVISSSTVNGSNPEIARRSFTFNLDSLGLHSIEVVAYDKAGNHLVARRLALYDDNSTVSLQRNRFTRVESASSETDYKWISSPTSDITLVWPKRFINVKHDHNNWLAPVESLDIQDDVLEDNEGVIRVSGVVNKEGIGQGLTSFVNNLYVCVNTASNVGHFEGWFDELSGIERWDIITLEMAYVRGYWRNMKVISSSTVNGSNPEIVRRSFTFNLDSLGLHSIEVVAYDKAGNHLVARRLVLYDDNSTVSLQRNRFTRVESASSETDYKWISSPTSDITLVWPKRFINVKHDHNNWLAPVESLDVQHDVLEDNEGVIRVSGVVNKEGIVRMEMAYQVKYEGEEANHTFEVIPDIGEEATINENYADGKKLIIRIRGYDVFNKYAEDTVVVKEDSSPPVIRNLWLTKGDKLNISAHSLTELNQMTIEWETYDEHSGLHEVAWELMDNYTNFLIVHGRANVSPQGEAETFDDCLAMYSAHARGANCYCTPFDGCFHQHFQVKPKLADADIGEIKLTYGLPGGGYFIKITVTNKAMLSTVLYTKLL